jgi:hypothetical protein
MNLPDCNQSGHNPAGRKGDETDRLEIRQHQTEGFSCFRLR